MGIGKVVTTVFMTIILVSFIVFLIELLVPFSIKKDFDITCDRYKEVANENGGLNVSEVNSLHTDLVAMDLSNITINISAINTVSYKDDIVFEVDADYSYSTLSPLFTRNTKMIHLKFHRSFANKIILN